MPDDENANDLNATAFYAGNPTDKTKLQEHVATFTNLITDFENDWEITLNVSELVLYDILFSYSRDLTKLKLVDGVEPSAFKQAAYMAFWIKKLKPLHTFKINENSTKKNWNKHRKKLVRVYINEWFAAYIAYQMIESGVEGLTSENLDNMKKQILKNQKFFHDIRYGFQSPNTLSVYFHLIVEGKYPSLEGNIETGWIDAKLKED